VTGKSFYPGRCFFKKDIDLTKRRKASS